MVSPEQLEAWKKAHTVFELEVDGKKAYLKKPDRKIISMVQSLGGESQVTVAELLLDACWLGGDETIKSDDDLFLSAMPTLNSLMDIKAASLKKI